MLCQQDVLQGTDNDSSVLAWRSYMLMVDIHVVRSEVVIPQWMKSVVCERAARRGALSATLLSVCTSAAKSPKFHHMTLQFDHWLTFVYSVYVKHNTTGNPYDIYKFKDTVKSATLLRRLLTSLFENIGNRKNQTNKICFKNIAYVIKKHERYIAAVPTQEDTLQHQKRTDEIQTVVVELYSVAACIAGREHKEIMTKGMRLSSVATRTLTSRSGLSESPTQSKPKGMDPIDREHQNS